MNESTASSLGSDPSVRFGVYERALRAEETPVDRITVPKYEVPSLPDRFERTWLADVPEGAVASYRDMDAAVSSTHVHEFPGYWELHVDQFNPHYRPVEHALADSELSELTWEPLTTIAVSTVGTLDLASDLALDAAGLGSRQVRAVGETALKEVVRGVVRGADVLDG